MNKIVPVLNGQILQGPRDISPPVQATQEGAIETLTAIAWQAARHVAKHDPTIAWPKATGAQVTLLRDLWDTNRQFRLSLAEMMVHIIDEMDLELGMAKPMLLQWVETNGIHHSGGWDSIELWLKAQRDKYTPAGGYWADLGRLTDSVIPFVQANMPDAVDPACFLDSDFIGRLRPAIPPIIQAIKDPDIPLEKKIESVKSVLGFVSQAENRNEVIDAFRGEPRKAPVKAYVWEPFPDKRFIIIELPTGPAGDAFVKQVKRNLSRRLKWTE